ncbi:unnamed protein product [Effrenium voratum]|nr:unnamed protein product [Effrenium voratum]
MMKADDHYEQDEERQSERRLARVWACASLVVGSLLVLASMIGSQSEAILLMDRVVRLDTAGPYGGDLDGASRVLTTLSLVHVLLFVGFAVVVTSLLGLTATQGRHKCLAASYAISSASLAAVTLILALQVLQRIQVVTPMVGRQVEHLCNATTYIQMGSALECHWASHYAGEGVQPCGVACNWKVSMLQQKGCHLMPQLCEAFDYQALPAANCSQLLGEASQTLPSQRLFVASAGEANCRRACDKDIQCRDFAHEEASKLCLHFSGTVALHAAPWAPLAPSQVQSSMKAATCWRRSDPMILQRFAMHNTRLATTAILLAIILGVRLPW